MRHYLIMAIALAASLSAAGQTLQECQEAAERNYPLIRQYGLIERTTQLSVENIRKGWLPQLSAMAQATLQSDVTAFPDELQTLYQQAGITMEGLKRDQYRVGVDISQTVFDGGAIRHRQTVAQREGDVERAETAVSLYAVRQRVNEMYFGLLLIDEQIRLKQDLAKLLEGSEQKLASMFKRGTAAESDYLAVKAERLGVEQQVLSLQSQRQSLAGVLSTFCGLEVSAPVKPNLPVPLTTWQTAQQRPELQAIDARLRLVDAQEAALTSGLLPKLSIFAQGFYGYPGYNMFEDMMRRRWSLNGMIGARLTWNIGALYTHRNDKSRLQSQREAAEVSREVFLFNNRLEQMQQSDEAERYHRLTESDAEIVSLRASVRRAAESKLAHGIIDTNDLVKEMNLESAARIQQSVHEIEMLKKMYELKITRNN
ncbi:MAG: TolC family protein [Prevotella sp.]|nr:TolC family protein [Prevotella sp.]